MENRPIRNIDRVPDWIRHTIAADEAGTEEVRLHTSQHLSLYIPDPKATSEETKEITVELFIDESNQEKGKYEVQLYWAAPAGDRGKLYQKDFKSAGEATLRYNELKKNLQDINALAQTDMSKAKELASDLFTGMESTSDQIITEPSGRPAANSSLHQEIVKGWEIINKEGKLLVGFSEEFLNNSFRRYKRPLGEPIQPSERVYSTTTKLHCGVDNFIVSYWGKVKTSDGNIIRNAILVERFNTSENYFLSGVSKNDFDIICESLTPDPISYGLSYDSITRRWNKISKTILQNIFFDTVEELIQYKEKTEKGKTETTDILPLPKPEKKEKVKPGKSEKMGPEDLDISDAARDFMTKPLAPGEMSSTPPSKSIELPATGLVKQAEEAPKADPEVGDEAIFLDSIREYVKGKVIAKTEESVTLEVMEVGNINSDESLLTDIKPGEQVTLKFTSGSFIKQDDLDRMKESGSVTETPVEPEVGSTDEPEAVKEDDDADNKDISDLAEERGGGEEDVEEGSPDMPSHEDELSKQASLNLVKIVWPKGYPEPWMEALYERMEPGVAALPSGGGHKGLIPYPGRHGGEPTGGRQIPATEKIPGHWHAEGGDPYGHGPATHSAHEMGYGQRGLLFELKTLSDRYKETLKHIDIVSRVKHTVEANEGDMDDLLNMKGYILVGSKEHPENVKHWTVYPKKDLSKMQQENKDIIKVSPQQEMTASQAKNNALERWEKVHLEEKYTVPEEAFRQMAKTEREKYGPYAKRKITPLEEAILLEQVKQEGEPLSKEETAKRSKEKAAKHVNVTLNNFLNQDEEAFRSTIHALALKINKGKSQILNLTKSLKRYLIDPETWGEYKVPSPISDDIYKQAIKSIFLKYAPQSSLRKEHIDPSTQSKLLEILDKQIPEVGKQMEAVAEELIKKDEKLKAKLKEVGEMEAAFLVDIKGSEPPQEGGVPVEFSVDVREMLQTISENSDTIATIYWDQLDKGLAGAKEDAEYNQKLEALDAKRDEIVTGVATRSPGLAEKLQHLSNKIREQRMGISSFVAKEIEPLESKLAELEKEKYSLLEQISPIFKGEA